MPNRANAADLAQEISRGMNALGLVAAPMAWKANQEITGADDLRQGILGAIDDLIEKLKGVDEPFASLTGFVDPGELVRTLSGLRLESQSWSSGPPPKNLMVLAREALTTLGVPEPDDGWGGFRLDT